MPNDEEVNSNSNQYAEKDDKKLSNWTLDFENHVGNPWHDNEELKFTRWVPSPVKAAFVSNDIAWKEVNGHCEH